MLDQRLPGVRMRGDGADLDVGMTGEQRAGSRRPHSRMRRRRRRYSVGYLDLNGVRVRGRSGDAGNFDPLDRSGPGLYGERGVA